MGHTEGAYAVGGKVLFLDLAAGYKHVHRITIDETTCL